MRLVFAVLLALGLAASAGVLPIDALAGDSIVAAAQQPIGQLEVDINTDEGGWYANPVWIGIGVIALIALIAIIIAASRGGTTVIKE